MGQEECGSLTQTQTLLFSHAWYSCAYAGAENIRFEVLVSYQKTI
jgi:hypothetical protein